MRSGESGMIERSGHGTMLVVDPGTPTCDESRGRKK
jgi:hypothetical protein